MAFTKVTDPVNNVSNLANQPVESPTTLKAVFDEIGKDLKTYINNTLTPELESTNDGDSGADNIGATPLNGGTANTVQGILEELSTEVDDVVLGQIPDGSLTDIKLSNTLGQTKDKANNYSMSDEGLASIDYWTANEVRVYKTNFTLKGFRFRGANYKRIGKSVSLNPTILYPTLDFRNIPITTGHTFNQWYACFGVLKPGQTYAELVSVPFLRVLSTSGNEIRFNECGVNSNAATEKIYNFNDMTGFDLLYISQPNNFLGITGKVASNTTSRITVDSLPATVVANSWILPAPQLDDYVYLGSFYVDNAAIFNRGDASNGLIEYTGVQILGTNISGNISAGVDIDFSTFISPMASGVYFYVYNTFSIATTGADYITFGTDSAHEVTVTRMEKITTSSDALRHYATVPFSLRQKTNIKSGGLGNSATDRSIHVRGFIEK